MTNPQSPEEWNDANQTLFRDFKFNSTADIECLMRLVKDNLYDGGNEGYLRARLLGILRSMYTDANMMFWTRHYHPKTWRLRLFIKRMSRKYHRRFKTRTFRGEVMMCNLATEVVNEVIEEEKAEKQ